jgi:hypothetical protein
MRADGREEGASKELGLLGLQQVSVCWDAMAVETIPRQTQAQRRNESAASLLNAAAQSIAAGGNEESSSARMDIHTVRCACREWDSTARLAPPNRRTAREERRASSST